MSQTAVSQIRIQILGQSDQYPKGTAEIRKYSSQEIFQKVLKNLGLYWSLALFCIFLPVVHFVLVPLFLLLGLLLAIRARKLREEIMSASLLCPHCSQEIKMNQKAVLWPHTEICPHCAFVLRIEPVQ